jgi:ABC-type transport system involved in cytochrome bd biosynthesis fused ATPase/permease subunit
LSTDLVAHFVFHSSRAQAVDAHVSKHLFEECLNGALKQKTRVLVTHQLAYLVSPHVDHIVVLKDGRIHEQVGPNALESCGPGFSNFFDSMIFNAAVSSIDRRARTPT